MTTHLTLFADYHQIQVMDEVFDGDLGGAWTTEAWVDGVAVAGGAVAIGTEDNLDVCVDVEILDAEPTDDGLDFDHVVEASLSISSGRVVVKGCTDYLPDAARFEIPAGAIRVRASRSYLDAPDCTDGVDATEFVRLQFWPGPLAGPRVIRRRTTPQP
ncbi:hypothetical protein ACFV1W_34770 [Kitasatospora sp. NPDC059648]|uniref:hypothetical protein n=1 Tax=Kitasatospora sp. NPDC059648 TaxID=3346894 RepID=UPI0036BC58DB